jgi:hypothetical protein
LNCFIANSDSVAQANEKKIIFKENSVEFNMKKFFKNFFEKVTDEHLLFESYKPSKITISRTGDPAHYTYTVRSMKYKDKNISTNFTSNEKLKIYKETILGNDKTTLKEEVIKLNKKHTPNVLGENKYNYLVNPYELDNKMIMREIESNLIKQVNTQKSIVNAFFLDSKDDKIMCLKNSKLIANENSPTLKEYAKEYKLELDRKIGLLEQFEKKNENYLNTPEGKKNYDIVKKYLNLFKFDMNDND